MKISQEGIRRKNLGSLLAALGNDQKSRMELAECTNLSLMTVGKLVNFLIEAEILIEAQADRNGTGRRAGLVSVNPQKLLLVLDVTMLNFEGVFLDFCGRQVDVVKHTYEDIHCFDDNLTNFLRRVSDKIQRLSKGALIDAAVSTPGPYNKETEQIINKRIPQLNHTCISAKCEATLGFLPSVICEDVKLAAKYGLKMLPKAYEQVVFYIYVGNGVGGSLCVNGNTVTGLSCLAGELGQIVGEGGQTYEDMLLSVDTVRAAIPLMTQMINNLLWLLDPHALLLDCRRFAFDDNERKMLEQSIVDLTREMERRVPEITYMDNKMQCICAGCSVVSGQQLYRWNCGK